MMRQFLLQLVSFVVVATHTHAQQPYFNKTYNLMGQWEIFTSVLPILSDSSIRLYGIVSDVSGSTDSLRKTRIFSTNINPGLNNGQPLTTRELIEKNDSFNVFLEYDTKDSESKFAYKRLATKKIGSYPSTQYLLRIDIRTGEEKMNKINIGDSTFLDLLIFDNTGRLFSKSISDIYGKKKFLVELDTNNLYPVSKIRIDTPLHSEITNYYIVNLMIHPQENKLYSCGVAEYKFNPRRYQEAFIAQHDSTGAIKWSYSHAIDTGNRSSFGYIIPTMNKEIIAIGCSRNMGLIAMRFDETGRVLNFKKHMPQIYDCMTSIAWGNPIYHPDSSIVFSGMLFNNGIPTLTKINQALDIVWHRTYKFPDKAGYGQIWGVKENLQKNGYILYGTANDTTLATGQQNAWLMTTDSFGCVTPGCHLTDAVQEITIEKTKQQLLAAPNPTALNTTIHFSKPLRTHAVLQIMSEDGKLITQHPLEKQTTSYALKTEAYKSGRYYVLLLEQNVLTASMILVVE